MSDERDPDLAPENAAEAEHAEVDADVSALREALDTLRQEIRSRFPVPVDEDEPRPPIEWPALLGTLRRRLSTIGMVERSGEVDEFGMDEIVLRRARTALDLPTITTGGWRSTACSTFPTRARVCWSRIARVCCRTTG